MLESLHLYPWHKVTRLTWSSYLFYKEKKIFPKPSIWLVLKSFHLKLLKFGGRFELLKMFKREDVGEMPGAGIIEHVLSMSRALGSIPRPKSATKQKSCWYYWSHHCLFPSSRRGFPENRFRSAPVWCVIRMSPSLPAKLNNWWGKDYF